MIFGIRNNRVPEAVTIRELVDWIIADCPMIDLVTSGIIADGYMFGVIALDYTENLLLQIGEIDVF